MVFRMVMTQLKFDEAIKKAVEEMVDEIDVVANIAAIKSGDWAYTMNDADSMVRLGHMRNLKVKWIIEMNLLTSEEIKHVCEIAVSKEVDFVKTEPEQLEILLVLTMLGCLGLVARSYEYKG